MLLIVLASAVPFAFELREVMYADAEQQDEENVTVPATPTPRPTPTPPAWRQLRSVSGVFTKTRALRETAQCIGAILFLSFGPRARY